MEIKQSYKEVHKWKFEASVMPLEEEVDLWYYDIIKFLELGAYLDGADKREGRSIKKFIKEFVALT